MKRSYIKAACFIIMAVAFHVHIYAHEKDDKPSGTRQKSSSSAATTEWHIDGSVEVTGTKTFTISNFLFDYASLFELKADLSGGIKGIMNNSGNSEAAIKVYASTNNSMPIYSCYSKSTSTSYVESSSFILTEIIPIDGIDGTSVKNLTLEISSTDIKELAQKQFLFNSKTSQTSTKTFIDKVADTWNALVGGKISKPAFKETLTDQQPYVNIYVTVTDATLQKIKIPGIGEYTPLALFTNDAPTKIVEAYVDGTLQHSYSNSTDAATNTLTATEGETITFKAWANGTDADYTNLTVSGFPGTWLARFAGEAMYWCTPSITPGDYRPFLGFDAQIHGTALRRYPDNFITNENAWQYDDTDETYSWSYIVQREMDTSKTTYTPQAVWNKQHTVGSVTQRRNQREGVNMQFLYSWPASNISTKGRWNTSFASNQFIEDPDDADDFTEGIDDDELIYLSNNGNGKTPSEVLYSSVNSNWKQIQDGETDCSVCDMVTAYKQQQYYLQNADNNSAYSGHEIEDEGCVKATDDSGYVKVTKDYEISANYNFPAGNEYGNSVLLNNKEPGQVTVFGFDIPVESTAPVSVNYGFYGMIEGTQYPSVGEDATYKIIGLIIPFF